MKAERNYYSTGSPEVDEIGPVKAIRFIRLVLSMSLIAFAWIGTAQRAACQDIRAGLATAGVNENGDPVINLVDLEGDCWETQVTKV
jgi:hypothetical protein